MYFHIAKAASSRDWRLTNKCRFFCRITDWVSLVKGASGSPSSALSRAQWKSVFCCSGGTSCVSLCARYYFSHCQAPLKRACLCRLRTFSSCVHTHWWYFPWAFSSLSSPSFFGLSSCDVFCTHHFHVPLLDSFQYAHVTLVWRSPALDRALQIWTD